MNFHINFFTKIHFLSLLIRKNSTMSIPTIVILIFIGLAAGLLSGIIGIGGGLIMIPLLILLLGLDQHTAQGTSLAVMLPPIGILAAMNYYKSGNLNWEYALIIASTFIVGGYFGSKIALQLSPQVLRKVFGVIMLVASLKMIFSK
ncbi:MAG: TSUP family transporter [Flavobacteriales bacterium]